MPEEYLVGRRPCWMRHRWCGDITVGVMSSAVAEAASLADMAEVASSADLVEVTTNRTILTMMIRVILTVTLVCMALLGRIVMSCIMICMGRMTVVYCVSRGDAGVVPYWSGDDEEDVHEGDVALSRAGSDELVNSSCIPCNEEGVVSEGNVAMHRTGSDETVVSVVSTIVTNLGCVRGQYHTNNEQTQSDECII